MEPRVFLLSAESDLTFKFDYSGSFLYIYIKAYEQKK